MVPLYRPLTAMAEVDSRGPVPVAVLAIGQHAGETVFVIVDRFGLVDTVSEGRVRILDSALQATAAQAEAREEAIPS